VSVSVVGPTVSVGNATGLEPDSGSVGVYVPFTLSAPAAADVTIKYYTVNGTAVGGAACGDFKRQGTEAAPVSVTIPKGQRWNAAAPLICADSLVESNENFQVVISSISSADPTVTTGDGSATVTIVDSSRADSNPLLDVVGTTVAEGDTGNQKAQFVIYLSKPVATDTKFTYYTVDGTAHAGTDYGQVKPTTFTVKAGKATAQTVDVSIAGNTLAEDDKSFTLVVVPGTGSPVDIKSDTGTMTIVNDDN
jgi:hypothetical protein